MSHDRFAFLNEIGVVVQVIRGDLTEQQVASFIQSYFPVYGAISAVQVADDRHIWIGGNYTDGEFAPPPAPEPLPEPLPEPQLEPQV